MRWLGIGLVLLLLPTVLRAESDEKDEDATDRLRPPAVVEGEKGLEITVRGDPPKHLRGQPLRVLRKVSTPDEWAHVAGDVKLDDDGRVTVTLSRGRYVFEVLSVTEDGQRVLAVNASAVVDGPKSVDLKAGEPRPVSAWLDKQSIDLEQFAMRGFSLIGEARWEAKDHKGATRPELITSAGPDEKPRVSILGRVGPTRVALWEVAPASGPCKLEVEGQALNALRFERGDVGKAWTKTTVICSFPDASEMGIELQPNARLLTNRKSFSISYCLEGQRKRVWRFQRRALELKREQTITVGGELKPSAWVGLMPGWRKGQNIAWGCLLTDPAGHILDVRRSEPKPKMTASLDDGPESSELVLALWEEGGGAEEHDAKLPPRVRVTVTWDGIDGQPRTERLTPAVRSMVTSDHFSIRAPAARAQQARAYLAKLEQLLTIERELTGRRGPSHVVVQLHTTRSGGMGLMGKPAGGGRTWMRIPHTQFDNDDDPFATPPTVAHELLHNFGYPHGDDIKRFQHLARHVFSLNRGKARG
jgi:hypothetical protein